MRLLLITSLVLLTGWLYAQQILSVRQGFDDGVTTFSDIQAAVDAAEDNTIIYVYPGAYTGVNIGKPVQIFGVGYRLFDNYDLDPAYANSTVVAGTITIGSGGEGATVQSLELESLVLQDVHSVLLRKLRLNGRSTIEDCTNITVSQCYVGTDWQIGNGASSIQIMGTSDITFISTIFVPNYRTCNFGCVPLLYSVSGSNSSNGTDVISVSFERCLFTVSNNFQGNGFVSFSNCIFHYNFSAGNASPGTGSFTSASAYNYASGSSPSGGNNYTSIPRDDFFVGYGVANSPYTFDSRFQLKENSPLRGGASDGGDVGPFGGSTPYVLSGLPTIPFIYDLAIPQEASTGGGIDVNIKVRTQN